MPGKHPAAPPSIGDIKNSKSIIATAQAVNLDDSAITGAGYLVGMSLSGGSAAEVTVRDTNGSGAIIYYARLGNIVIAQDWPPTHWREFANGFHVTIAGTFANGISFQYRPIA